MALLARRRNLSQKVVMYSMTDDRYAQLRQLLAAIQAADREYSIRYGFVLDALAEAHRAGLEAGVRCNANESEWPVAYIELPTGQVSWHLPQHQRDWDGHSTAEKYARLARFLRSGETPV